MCNNVNNGSPNTQTQPPKKRGKTATSPVPITGARREDDELYDFDNEPDEEEVELYETLDPAFSSWEEVNSMFY